MGKSRKVALAGAMPSRKSRKVSQVEEKVSLATVTDSRLVAEKIFLTMIEPTTLYDFRARYWEKEPLVIKRSQPEHFSSWFSMDELDKLLRSGKLVFGRHIDITSYSLEEGRKTWNKEGVADADYVWGMFKKGCSMRLYHPQEFLDKFWHINACLQEHFGCLVGANIYVTPANSQVRKLLPCA
jgi:lysine-specific demethylase/histidyl-hydroxylase NO66